MRSAKSIPTLCAAVAFAVAAAIASPAFATNNQQSGTVVSQADLVASGWYCMQSSEAPYYYLCTKVFDQTYECHFGICSPASVRPAGNRVSRNLSGAVTARTAPQTNMTGTNMGTATARAHH
jgi:hypothetical protein